MNSHKNNNILEKPKRLVVEISTKCNFSCNFCPLQSSEYKNNSNFMPFSIFKNLESLLPYLDSLVISGFGEPLLNPQLIDIVKFAKKGLPENSKLAIQTNGMLLTEDNAKKLIHSGINKFCISIDTLKDSYGHRYDFVTKALEILHNLRISKYFRYGVETVIIRDNLNEIVELINRVLKYGIDFTIISHLIPYSPEMTSKVLYDTNNVDSVKIFDKWLQILQKRGYKIEDWLDIAKKMAGEGIDFNEEVYELYKGMYDDALKQGLSLNLPKLMQIDRDSIKEVEEVLSNVKRICSEKGVEIKIPGIYPKAKRRCEFVEENCMFVSVDGEVSPCYFLWHAFKCYIAQLKKSVKKFSFGNININDPIEIYNQDNYKKFRNSVLKYEFPYCYDCNFALCDLMELEDFMYDCYSNEIPCGACLWCGELFYCMI